jgi:hypothetical protein
MPGEIISLSQQRAGRRAGDAGPLHSRRKPLPRHSGKTQRTHFTAHKETKRKAALLEWRDEIASKVIAAALEDAALRFHDDVDDEELEDENLGSLDLEGNGEYDPIIDEKTGVRLSGAIEEFAGKQKCSIKMIRAAADQDPAPRPSANATQLRRFVRNSFAAARALGLTPSPLVEAQVIEQRNEGDDGTSGDG